FRVLFIESICSDPRVVEANVRDTKRLSPDYVGFDPEEAVRDFRARIAHYESVYEPVDEQDASYIKLIDVGRQIVVNRIRGYLPARLVFFLLNLQLTPRPVWLTRHGASVFNDLGLIGGDPSLGPSGEEYARALAQFMKQRVSGGLRVWTSTLKR